jgi:predicted transposase/invertase (TIGR01784 family)
MDTAIQKAKEKMEYVSRDKEALRAYQMRELAMSDWTSGLNHARREGALEGERKKAIEIARNLKGIGISGEQIANATGLPLEEIRRI